MDDNIIGFLMVAFFFVIFLLMSVSKSKGLDDGKIKEENIKDRSISTGKLKGEDIDFNPSPFWRERVSVKEVKNYGEVKTLSFEIDFKGAHYPESTTDTPVPIRGPNISEDFYIGSIDLGSGFFKGTFPHGMVFSYEQALDDNRATGLHFSIEKLNPGVNLLDNVHFRIQSSTFVEGTTRYATCFTGAVSDGVNVDFERRIYFYILGANTEKILTKGKLKIFIEFS